MKKPIWVTLAVIGALALGVGAWLVFGAGFQKGGLFGPNQNSPETTIQREDFSSSTDTVTIKIKDLSYTPANIKIKKGTKVVWVNEDGIANNVVADDVTNTGGLPTDAPVLGRSDTYQLTFRSAGLFLYHSSANTFVHGSVEVVD